MVTDGNYTRGQQSVMHRLAESLGCACEINITLCANDSSVKKRERDMVK